MLALTPLEQQLLKALKDLVHECDIAEDAEDIDDVQSEAERAKRVIRDAERMQ